ncbi:dihydroneopterin aldolase [Rhodobacter aestuarii]|uniref:Dihydroneopterin aldolase n=1 Tax=Rhodobacter aestuarii TaxID=453582 RepID=A0A1N7NPS7_9RHOB|nr:MULTISPECIES: dihydroneopterin aldolase [Rhodobacter]PTV94633.1 dihydroneopterin aldolase [Rhodobacter aestuarii]SIT00302.1 dihydroneopterin aldolase [Rhodobacter aestuarii]SOC12890.1 dihydroneopterin aldolase [Rhodobacter sp. JA431]
MAEMIIRLEELEITMYLGIHDFERARPQRVLISAEITVTGTDWQAGKFFDYDPVAEFVRAFNGTRIDTQEELVSRIHAFVHSREGVVHAAIWSKKPDVYPDAKAVGVVLRG